MTHPSSPPAPMTAEDLRVLGMKFAGGALTIPETADLFRHIDALTSRVAELEGAIRKFPHFENNEPITAEAISNVAGEHVDMIMSWVPVQTKIAFVDDDGRQFEIVYEDGDSDAGIPSGWCVPEDADWQPARRGIETELAAATRRVAELERERDTWQAEMDEKISEAEEAAEQHREWPAWAKGILKDLTGLGYQYDAGEDIDLRGDFIDHVNEWMRGIERDWKDRALKAEAELAAARKVEDGEVKDALHVLFRTGNPKYEQDGFVAPSHTAIGHLLTRLSAALKEAETRSLDNAVRAHGWMVQHDTLLGFIQARQSVLNELIDNDPRPASPKPSDVPDIIARAQAAEEKLESARRDALEEAALVAEGWSTATNYFPTNLSLNNVASYVADRDFKIGAAIRTLQTKDTTE